MVYLSKSQLLDETALCENLRTSSALEVFRQTLNSGLELLKSTHTQGASAPTLVQHHAWFIDRLLHHAWRTLLEGSGVLPPMTLVAVGGYGRGELHPYSDIDIMVLLQNTPSVKTSDFIATFLRLLWDIGLDVGHSVRTQEECLDQAKNDLATATNLMESRPLEGERELWRDMHERTSASHIWDSKEFFAAKLSEQNSRHSRFDDTAYNLEPNIKEGKGGLRDLQILLWVAQRHFGSTTLKSLIDQGFLSADEHRILIRSRNFLWRIRNGLHWLTGRREDRLLFDHQRSLASEFGYRDKEHKLAVEQFMKRYYLTIKELRLLSEILLQHFQEAILSPKRVVANPIDHQFKEIDGFLEVTNDRVFNTHPEALLKIFLTYQQHEHIKGIRAHTIRLIRANLKHIDASFRRRPECRELFLQIFKQPDGLTRALRRMNAYGVIGVYLPVFGKVVGQMQHDLFHVYTVDAHSLFVVRNLRRFALQRFAHELPQATVVMKRLVKRERLYLAGLFHDIAKGRGGDHSELGQKEALRFCLNHNLSRYDADFVAWLVRNHLAMSWIAQRKDISDFEVIAEFANTVGNQERLDNLYLLTMADIRGTSPRLWNSWKGRLLEELYHATTRMLRHEESGLEASSDTGSYRIAQLKSDALSLLDTNLHAVTKRWWETLDCEYFNRHDADAIAWHTDTIVNARAIDIPLVNVRYQNDIEANQVLVMAPNADDLLCKVTGGFDSLRLTILDARLHRVKSGFNVMAFIALNASGHPLTEEQDISHITNRLRQRMLAPFSAPAAQPVHLPRKLKHFPITTSVTFHTSRSGAYTIMEVFAQDRPGLLFEVAQALLAFKIQLQSAKVTTIGERAEDVFFITDRDGNAIREQQVLDGLRQLICTALDSTPSVDQSTKQ